MRCGCEVGHLCLSRYHQFFDLEGETGIVVRGFGTCALVKYPATVEEQVSVVAQTISEDR